MTDTGINNFFQSQKNSQLSSEEIWWNWKEQASLNNGWLTFIEEKSEIGNSRATIDSQLYKIKKNEPGYLKIDLEDLQNHSLILLNSSISQENEAVIRYLVCPSLDFAPLPNNCPRCIYFPQSEAKQSKIKFNAKANEEFIAIVLNSLPSISWLLINKQSPHPILSEQKIYELGKYLNDLNQDDWQIFYQSFEVK